MTAYYDQQPGAQPPSGWGTEGDPANQELWFHRTWVIVAALVLLPPIGIALMWTRPGTRTRAHHVVVTAAASVWTVALVVGWVAPASSTTPSTNAVPTTPKATSSSPSPTAPATTSAASPAIAPTTQAPIPTPTPAQPSPVRTTAPRPRPTTPRTTVPPPHHPPQPDCDPSYPDVCIPPVSVAGDLDCPDISFRNFRVLPPDPHGFDRDHDGVGCESN